MLTLDTWTSAKARAVKHVTCGRVLLAKLPSAQKRPEAWELSCRVGGTGRPAALQRAAGGGTKACIKSRHGTELTLPRYSGIPNNRDKTTQIKDHWNSRDSERRRRNISLWGHLNNPGQRGCPDKITLTEQKFTIKKSQMGESCTRQQPHYKAVRKGESEFSTIN